jgi:hypothetical protein
VDFLGCGSVRVLNEEKVVNISCIGNDALFIKKFVEVSVFKVLQKYFCYDAGYGGHVGHVNTLKHVARNHEHKI